VVLTPYRTEGKGRGYAPDAPPATRRRGTTRGGRRRRGRRGGCGRRGRRRPWTPRAPGSGSNHWGGGKRRPMIYDSDPSAFNKRSKAENGVGPMFELEYVCRVKRNGCKKGPLFGPMCLSTTRPKEGGGHFFDVRLGPVGMSPHSIPGIAVPNPLCGRGVSQPAYGIMQE